MLSSQTKDDTTYHAMMRLRELTLTPESICEIKLNVLENILHPVSFYKVRKYPQENVTITSSYKYFELLEQSKISTTNI